MSNKTFIILDYDANFFNIISCYSCLPTVKVDYTITIKIPRVLLTTRLIWQIHGFHLKV